MTTRPIDCISAPASRISDHIPRLGLLMPIFLLLLLFWSRYLPAPMAVFVADDWSNWSRASFYGSVSEAFRTGLQDPNRPLSMAMVESVFHLCGNQAWFWTAISLAGNVCLLLLVIWTTWSLTRKASIVFLSGIIFSVLPNLTETYHWSTQVLNEVSCGLVFYALSGFMWVEYARRGGIVRLAVSVIAFMIGLFSYEAGILLPAAYVFLLPWRKRPVASLLRLVPFGLVVLAYLGWRITDALGTNQTWRYPPHMEAGLSIGGIVWNLRQILQWWMGDHFFGAILNGLDSFSTLPPWTRRLLVAGNIAMAGVTGIIYRAMKSDDRLQTTVGGGQVFLFALMWTGAALAINLLSYTAGRLNVLPAIGICWLLAMVLDRLPRSVWMPLLFVPAILCMTANQGTSESYRQAGAFNRRLFAHFQETAPLWKDKRVIFLDTSAIRNRQAPGLLRPAGVDPDTWANYNNALLLRGFVPGGMMRLAIGQARPDISIAHDVENGARVEGNFVVWHDRFNPARSHTNLLGEAFVIDLGAVVWTPAAP